MKKRHMIGATTSLIGGVGAGAILMYLLDPSNGRGRRSRIADSAEHAASSARHAMSNTHQAVRDSAGHLTDSLGRAWSGVTERARHLRHHGMEDLGAYASESATSARHAMNGISGRMQRRLRRHLPEGMKSAVERHPALLGVSVVMTTMGALALGAGIMYIMDPASGRRRRALVRDKATHYAHEASDTLSGKAHDLSNRARGIYARGKRHLSNVMPGQTPHNGHHDRPLNPVEPQDRRTMPSEVSGT